MIGPGAQPAEGAEIDDTPATAFPHEFRALLTAEEDRLEVHIVYKVPILFCNRERIEAREARRVIDETVQPAQPRLYALKERFNLADTLEIGSEQRRVSTLRGGSPGFFFRAAV